MAVFPCSTVLPECGCDENPSRNLSALAPDLPTFTGIAYVSLYPPLGTKWSARSCVGVCQSSVSQDAANQCATINGTECASSTWRGPDDGPQNPPVPPPVDTAGNTPYAQVLNTPQSCTVPCPDGSTFSFTTPFGTFGSVAQVGPAAAQALAQANAKAKSYACNQANLRKVCISGNLSKACVGQPYSGTITATGKFISVTPATDFWEIIFGAVPSGMTFHGGNVSGGTVLIDGTPTTAANEDYVFMVRVTDTNGGQQIKVFGITVGGITNLPPPAGSVGSDYTYQLTFAGFTSPLVTADVLPDGLTMDTSGLIQGTPTTAQTVNTTFTVEDGDRTCQQLAVVSIVAAGLNFNNLVWNAPTFVPPPGSPTNPPNYGVWDQNHFAIGVVGPGGPFAIFASENSSQPMSYTGPLVVCNFHLVLTNIVSPGFGGNSGLIQIDQDGTLILDIQLDTDTPYTPGTYDIPFTVQAGAGSLITIQNASCNCSFVTGIEFSGSFTPAF